MKNQVIKALTPEHGAKIIQYWKDKGVDTGSYAGIMCEADGDINCYYGVIDGKFGQYSVNTVREKSAKIIRLPEPSEDSVKQTYIFKEGDPVISKVHPGVLGFTVCGFEDKKRMYLICSPAWNQGHNGAHVVPVWGKVPDTSNNSCWWVHEEDLVLDNQIKEKDIDTFIINVGDYIKIIDRPTDGSIPTFWNDEGEMDYLYGTWQKVLGVDNDVDVKIYSDTSGQGVWYIHKSNIAEVRSYNPDKRNRFIIPEKISNISVNVTDINDDFITVDIAPSKPFASRLGDSMIVTKEMVASEIKKVYGEGGIYDDFINHLAHLGKDKSDLLNVPSLRVSRKNIKK